jgi:hypothetical protein
MTISLYFSNIKEVIRLKKCPWVLLLVNWITFPSTAKVVYVLCRLKNVYALFLLTCQNNIINFERALSANEGVPPDFGLSWKKHLLALHLKEVHNNK